jgi:hypothetical protein
MKKINTVLRAAGIGLFAALLLAGCFFEQVGGNTGAKTGKIEITIDGSDARTLGPVFTGVTYSVSATSGGTTVTSDALSFELAAGTWTFTVEAKRSDAVIGTGTATGVTVTAGSSTRVDIDLVPSGTVEGSLSWAINAPSDPDIEVKLEYYDGTNWESLIGNGNTFAAGTIALDPGSYLVRSSLKGLTTLGTAGDLEAVHIYSGLDTKVEWRYSASGLLPVKPFSGSVVVTPSDLTGISSVTADITGDGEMDKYEDVIFTKTTGNTWTFEVEIPENETSLNVTLSIVTTNNGETPLTVTQSGITTMTVTLTAVSVYTLSATVGENGILRVNGVALANNGKRDFVGGTLITLAGVGDGSGYETDELKADGSDYTAPFNITKDTAVAVTFKERTGVDPLLIFEWNAEQHGLPSDFTDTFTATPLDSDFYGDLVGSSNAVLGSISVLKINNPTHNRTVYWDNTRKGIVIDAITGTGSNWDAVLCIGTDGTVTTTPYTATAPKGVFSFRTASLDISGESKNYGVKISMDIDFLTVGAARQINVYLSHNAIGNASILSANTSAPVAGRPIFWSNPSTALAYTANNGGFTEGIPPVSDTSIVKRGLLYSRSISDADTGWATGTDTIRGNSFFSVAVQNQSATVNSHKFLIKSIKVEYVALTP